MHSEVTTEKDHFHQLKQDYYLHNKEVDGNAETNSGLNKELIEIMKYPSEFMCLEPA